MKAEIVLKYLTGDCSDEELVMIDQWLDEKSENREWLFELKSLWDRRTIADFSRREYLDYHFNEVLRKIELQENSLSTPASSKNRFLIAASLIAAASVLLFGVFIVSRNIGMVSKENYIVESVSSADSIRRIVLPDKSVVWLGADSKIEYLPSFSDKERKIILSGEAYFDVRKDSTRPFRVQTPEFTVKVLGTKFNVSSFNNMESAGATLFSGSIVIENDKEQELLLLTPGQKLSYSKDKRQMLIETVSKDNGAVLLTKNNFITFNSASVTALVKKLEYAYGISLNLDKRLLDSDLTYSGVLPRQDSIELVLKGLQNVIPFTFEHLDDGSFFLTGSD